MYRFAATLTSSIRLDLKSRPERKHVEIVVPKCDKVSIKRLIVITLSVKLLTFINFVREMVTHLDIRISTLVFCRLQFWRSLTKIQQSTLKTLYIQINFNQIPTGPVRSTGQILVILKFNYP
ncbi:hypothetical protein L2E82_16538 [Cichorium intybus]|uniref:Uncharacterized protein n=1 Tax=Cichorium intybus TaxID=13427 RepID=A0ACB9F5U1_CICIN|nr:hypothetical protein L2E82_16538 [Cichorium intybus]